MAIDGENRIKTQTNNPFFRTNPFRNGASKEAASQPTTAPTGPNPFDELDKLSGQEQGMPVPSPIAKTHDRPVSLASPEIASPSSHRTSTPKPMTPPPAPRTTFAEAEELDDKQPVRKPSQDDLRQSFAKFDEKLQARQSVRSEFGTEDDAISEHGHLAGLPVGQGADIRTSDNESIRSFDSAEFARDKARFGRLSQKLFRKAENTGGLNYMRNTALASILPFHIANFGVMAHTGPLGMILGPLAGVGVLLGMSLFGSVARHFKRDSFLKNNDVGAFKDSYLEMSESVYLNPQVLNDPDFAQDFADATRLYKFVDAPTSTWRSILGGVGEGFSEFAKSHIDVTRSAVEMVQKRLSPASSEGRLGKLLDATHRMLGGSREERLFGAAAQAVYERDQKAAQVPGDSRSVLSRDDASTRHSVLSEDDVLGRRSIYGDDDAIERGSHFSEDNASDHLSFQSPQNASRPTSFVSRDGASDRSSILSYDEVPNRHSNVSYAESITPPTLEELERAIEAAQADHKQWAAANVSETHDLGTSDRSVGVRPLFHEEQEVSRAQALSPIPEDDEGAASLK